MAGANVTAYSGDRSLLDTLRADLGELPAVLAPLLALLSRPPRRPLMVAVAAKRHAARVARALAAEYPVAECALTFRGPLQLLIATILSAQCTDERVNMVTPALFARYPTAADYAAAPLADLERAIQSTGFFRNKAKNIQACCARLVANHGGDVPRTLDELVVLPGVGRKTANVVLGTAFGVAAGVVVDTHVGRLSVRMGLTDTTNDKDAVAIERDLMARLPAAEWVAFSHRMIHHGRRVCAARKPRCESCVLAVFCPRIGVADSGKKMSAGSPRTSRPRRSVVAKPRKR